MSALASALEDYLALRRSLGFKLDRAGRLLAQFVAYCDTDGAEAVSIELAVAWAAQRLTVVRGFAKYLALVDERTEIPPVGMLPDRSHRATPYLYSEHEVLGLMAAARKLPAPMRQETTATSGRPPLRDRDARRRGPPARPR